MDKEECDFYQPISKKDKLCKSFIGDTKKQRDIDRCRYHCSTMDFKRLMQEGPQVLERHHGRLRRK